MMKRDKQFRHTSTPGQYEALKFVARSKKIIGKEAETHSDSTQYPPVQWTAFIGFLIIFLFMGGVIGWAAFAPLHSAAIAPGSVNLDTYRKTVQHYEGGIIDQILAREGRTVAKGDILIRLDQTRAKASIDLLEAQIAAEEKQLKFIAEEITVVEDLLDKGLAKRPRILELYRRHAELEGDRSEHLAQLRAAQDVIVRSIIRAPITGTVVGLQVHTTGGVIKGGEPLLSIVPLNEPMFIEARIAPNDIDIVHSGQPAQIRLTPFNARMAPSIPAVVEWISADALSDQATGIPFYLARIKPAVSPSEMPDNMQLYPGMPAEVMVLTGKRTFLDYLMAPLTRSFRRAFKEQ